MSQRIIVVIASYFVICNFIACEIPINCNPENVQRCWSYIHDSTIFKQVVPRLNNSALNDFCRKFDYFDDCFSPIREGCLNFMKFNILVLYEGHRNAFSFMCRETTGEYLMYQPCFDDQNLQLNTDKCNESLAEQLKRNQNETDVVTNTNKMCQAGDLFMGCVDNNVKVLCQESAATWMHNYNKRILSPLLSSLPCKGWTLNSTSTPNVDSTTITLAVCLSLICFVIIVLVLILVCHLKPQLFKSLPIVRRMNASRLFTNSKQESSCPPPYVVDSESSNTSNDRDGGLQTGPSDQGSFSSGFFSITERSPDETNIYYQDSIVPKKNNSRVGSMEVISFNTSGTSDKICKTMRSHSAECTPEIPQFIRQSSLTAGPFQHSSTITPPHFVPPVANPFTSHVLDMQKDDPIITDYYC